MNWSTVKGDVKEVILGLSTIGLGILGISIPDVLRLFGYVLVAVLVIYGILVLWVLIDSKTIASKRRSH